jgi:hypothetical protein
MLALPGVARLAQLFLNLLQLAVTPMVTRLVNQSSRFVVMLAGGVFLALGQCEAGGFQMVIGQVQPYLAACGCPRCGERYFAATVVREMEQQMKQPQQAFPTVSVPIIELKMAS